MLHGMYHWTPENIVTFEREMLPDGKLLDFVSFTTMKARRPGIDAIAVDLSNYDGTKRDFLRSYFGDSDRRLQCNVRIGEDMSPPVDYQPTIDGKYDDDYRTIAKELVALGCDDAMIRMGAEYNQPDWTVAGCYPQGGPSKYEDAFARAVSCLESVDGTNFWYLLDPAVTTGVGEADRFWPPRSSYWPDGVPGPIMAVTFYDNARPYKDLTATQLANLSAQDREQVWQDYILPNLQEIQAIGEGFGAKMASVEWGLQEYGTKPWAGGDDPVFIQNAFEFMHSNGWLTEGYWNGPPHTVWPTTDLPNGSQAWQDEVASDLATRTTLQVGGYTQPKRGTSNWDVPLNDNFSKIETDLLAIADRTGVTLDPNLSTPAKGTANWDVPLNDNFAQIESDVLELARNIGVQVTLDLAQPARGTTNWDVPLNDNFAQIETQLKALAAAV